MAVKIDPLTVLITAKNQSGSAFKELKNNLTSARGLAKLATTAIIGVGVAGASSFGALVAAGRETSLQLKTMGLLLNTNTREADALFTVLREGNPKANIDALSDGLLTLQERFSEARVDTGELFNWAQDFGVTGNFAIKGVRAQTVEFLKVLRQLPDAGDRASFAIAVLGDEGAHQFIPMLNNLEDIDDQILTLSGSIDDIPDVFSQQDSDNIDEYVAATGRLSIAFDELATEAFASVATGLTKTTNFFASVLEQTDSRLEEARRIIEQGASTTFDRLREGLPLQEPGIGSPDDFRNLTGIAQGPEEALSPVTQSLEAEVKTTKTRLTAAERAAQRAAEDARELAERLSDAEEYAYRVRSEGGAGGLNEGPGKDPQTVGGESVVDGIDSRFNIGETPDLDPLNDDLLEANDNSMKLSEGLGALGGAMQVFGAAALKNGSKSFKTFQKLQIAISTAAGIAAGVQTLADPTLPFLSKLAAFATIAGTVAGALTSLKSVNVDGGGGSVPSVPTASPGTLQPQAYQVPDTTSATAQQQVNINVQGRTFQIADLQEMAERMSKIPGLPLMKVSEVI